jgi:structural maintenance of chromosome 2
LEYQKATSELERLTRLVKAYEWTLLVSKAEKAGETLAAKEKEIEVGKATIKQGGKECAGMEREIDEIHKRREKVSDRFFVLWVCIN